MPFSTTSSVIDPVTNPVNTAQQLLRNNAYLGLRHIECTYKNGTLKLTGHVPTYYLKQMAQETCSHIADVDNIENRIVVMSNGVRF